MDMNTSSLADPNANAYIPKFGPTEERALTLLAQGIPPSQVAAACGVDASRISQLISQDEFKAQLSSLRYAALQKHNQRDNAYDSLEDILLDKLKGSIPMIYRPTELARVLQVINAAKRRGQSAPDAILEKKDVIPLSMPSVLIQKFTTNINNQVIQTGEQTLVTMQATSMDALASRMNPASEPKLLNNIPSEILEISPQGESQNVPRIESNQEHSDA